MSRASKIIHYMGTPIEVWEQSIRAGNGMRIWLKRPVETEDIRAVKSMIEAGRQSLAAEMRELRQKQRMLIGEQY